MTRRGAAWPAFWLAVACVGAKLVHWSAPALTLDALRTYLLDVAVSAHQDVAFAAGLALVGALLLRLTAARPRAQAVVWWLYLAFCLVCVVFAVASVQIFAFLRSPLTFALLYLADDFGNMRSSLGAFISPRLAAAFVLVPLLWALLTRFTLRRPPLRTRAREAVVVAWVCLLLWFIGGRLAYAGRWRDRDDHLIAKSPHWALILSYATEMLGLASAERFEQPYPKEYLSDFAPPPAKDAQSRFVKRPHPKNAILVVLESTGAKYLSVHGSKYATTPNLLAESRHALVDDAFYCHAGLTANSVAAITLSLYPYMTWREYTVEYPDMPGESLAQVLKKRGYRTAFIHSGDFQYVNQRNFLTGRGFDVLWDWRDLGAPLFTSWATHDQALIDGVIKWVGDDTQRPFFVKVWTHMSHHPYEPMPDRPLIDFFKDNGPLPVDDYDLGRHLNTIHFVDEQLGRLFAFLREKNLADDTLVIVTGDHGEAFGDPHQAWGHGSRVYDECARVPMMVWSPRLYPEGQRAKLVGGHVDINPTIADVLGSEASPTWRGRSLYDEHRTGRAYFYAANDDYLLGVREDKWKYIYNATRGHDELYDLEADKDEHTNVAPAHAELCKRLRQRLAAWRDDTGRHLAQIRAARGKP
jgi:arylsulfatase A-like enzyme